MQSPMSEQVKHYDAVIIGGGPSGASAAISLAQKNYKVLVLERDRFPRFHIGESLLPYNAGLLDKMNLLEKVEQGDYVIKRGAEFTGVSGQFRRVDFTAQGEGRKHVTFQVERAEFDRMLLNEAREAGAEVLHEATVTELLFNGERMDGVQYKHGGEVHTVKASFVIDASGRNGKIANHFKLRKMNPILKMVAVYKHFNNLDESKNPGIEGDIQIGNHEDGWLWAIPIHHDVISIGAVTTLDRIKNSTQDEIFNNHFSRVPRITQRLEGATAMGEVKMETDFSYHAEKVVGPGFLMVGDAGCFVDPIFSGGVYLGMITGNRAADAIDGILSGRQAEEQALTYYENFFKTGYDCYFRLIYAFYESDFNFGKYVMSIPFEVEGKWIARLLSGDFWSKHNPLTRYLRSVDRWQTFEPFEVVYGCPVYAELDAAEQEMMETV